MFNNNNIDIANVNECGMLIINQVISGCASCKFASKHHIDLWNSLWIEIISRI